MAGRFAKAVMGGGEGSALSAAFIPIHEHSEAATSKATYERCIVESPWL
jgi:hypothetical protein